VLFFITPSPTIVRWLSAGEIKKAENM